MESFLFIQEKPVHTFLYPFSLICPRILQITTRKSVGKGGVKVKYPAPRRGASETSLDNLLPLDGGGLRWG